MELATETSETRVEFVEANGLRFEVHQCGDPESRRLALCLHGFPEHAISWRFQLPLLARLGYKVWAPNQRGYGETTRPLGKAAYHVDELTADVAALIDAADCDEVLLLGHDWGGIVAWEFALRGLRPLERLVVMNIPHPRVFREALKTNKAQRRRSWYALFFQLPRIPEWFLTRRNGVLIERAFRDMAIDGRHFTDEVIDVYRRNALAPGAATAMINWYRAAFRAYRDEREEPILETPTLMIWGEADSALGIELTHGTERLVRDFTLHTLPGVSHWVQQEAPEKVNPILEDWLRTPRPA